MRKRILITILALLLCVALVGCGGGNTPDNRGGKTEEPVMVPAEFNQVLIDTYKLIYNIEDSVGPDMGMNGIWTAAKALGEKAFDQIGYFAKDLNGDGVLELIIGAFDKNEDAFTQNEIYSVWMSVDGQPEFIFDSSTDYTYSLKDNDIFFYHGGYGAFYEYGQFKIDTTGTLDWDEYCFTYPDDDNADIINVYYNTTGMYIREESEKLDITLDEFFAKEEAAAEGTIKLEYTPFSQLDEELIQKATEVIPAPDPALLEGEWVLTGGETDGYEYTAEEEGLEGQIIIEGTTAGMTAQYIQNAEYTSTDFESDLILLDEPVYMGCGNDEWSVKFQIYAGDNPGDEEYFATLIDDDTLLVQHFFPFDGARGVSYQYFARR